jgi:hypothetical protein
MIEQTFRQFKRWLGIKHYPIGNCFVIPYNQMVSFSNLWLVFLNLPFKDRVFVFAKDSKLSYAKTFHLFIYFFVFGNG